MTGSQYKEIKDEVKLTEVSEVVNAEETQPVQHPLAETRSTEHPQPAKYENAIQPTNEGETPPSLGPRYDILGLVGTGGMGTVWKVHDKELDEDFAIKVLKPELVTDETALKRFQKEANLASELTHANIAAIFGPGEDGAGRPYIIMRYVDGESLADIIKREGKLSEERAMDIFSQLCEALSHSHMKGIIHRDIKPSNIIISKTESGADLVQLVDFGIARCVYDEVTKTQALTKAVDVFGSPRYMSPEQLLGQEVSAQSDIYSLGIVMYEMLTGEPPFKAENPVELIVQQVNDKPDLSRVSDSIRYLLEACLHKQVGLRPKTVDILQRLAATNTSRNWAQPDIDSALSFGYVLISLMLVASLTMPYALDAAPGLFPVIASLIGGPTALWLGSMRDDFRRSGTNVRLAGKLLVLSLALFAIGFILSAPVLANVHRSTTYAALSQTIAIVFTSISLIGLGFYLKKTKNSFSFFFDISKTNYDTACKSTAYARLYELFSDLSALLLSTVSTVPLAIIFGFWLQSVYTGLDPQFSNPFNTINTTIGYGLVAAMLPVTSMAATKQLKNAGGAIAKRIPSARAQLAIFISSIAVSFLGSGLYLNSIADTGIKDYLKTSFADHRMRIEKTRANVPVPKRPDSYFGAIALIELSPFGSYSPLKADKLETLNQVLNSNLDPLLKTQVVALTTQPAGFDFTDRLDSDYYDHIRPLMEKTLSFLEAAPDRPAKLSWKDESADLWLRLALHTHPYVGKEVSLRALAGTTFQFKDRASLQRTVALMKQMRKNNPSDRNLADYLSSDSIQVYEKWIDYLNRPSTRRAER